ncbi:UNVERIFIED_CONTAM: hypothetical protein HHA_450030 [Hammondia hammondi]|eukprot:XP_008882684.1 hypothetical protein HHA_450030 [Hammondia hammondi]
MKRWKAKKIEEEPYSRSLRGLLQERSIWRIENAAAKTQQEDVTRRGNLGQDWKRSEGRFKGKSHAFVVSLRSAGAVRLPLAHIAARGTGETGETGGEAWRGRLFRIEDVEGHFKD